MTKFTIAQAEAALRRHAGVIAHAAEALGVDRAALWARIQRSERLQKAKAEAEEEIKDVAEGNILRGIKAGDKADAKWWLQQKAKERGFGKLAVDDDQLAAIINSADPSRLKKLASGED